VVPPPGGAGFILTFSKGLGEFGVQAFLGLPIRYYTLSTRIYSALNNQLYGEGYVLALILIIATTFVVILNQMVIGTRKRYVTISGKGSVKKQIKLGKWRIPVTVLLFAFVFLFIFGPLFLLVTQTFMKEEGVYSLSNFTLHYWIGDGDTKLAMGQPGIFKNAAILNATANSLKLSILVAIVSGIIGILIGYTVVKDKKTLLAKIIENLTFAPYLIPGVAFGGIYLTLFANYSADQEIRTLDYALEKMKERVPGVDNVESESTLDGRLLLKFQSDAFKDPFIDRYVSDGTMKMFAYLVLLYDPQPHPLLCIEEPENQLYPKLLFELAEEFRNYARKGGQVFVSTHSPDLLNAAKLEEVFWLKKEKGFTKIYRASDNNQICAYMDAGDKMGYLWKEGFFLGVDP